MFDTVVVVAQVKLQVFRACAGGKLHIAVHKDDAAIKYNVYTKFASRPISG